MGRFTRGVRCIGVRSDGGRVQRSRGAVEGRRKRKAQLSLALANSAQKLAATGCAHSSMRIKRASKKHPSTNAEIAAFILAANACADEELPQLLEPILSAGWAWPRTDLQHWIVPLNRFDRILEDVVQDYDLTSMLHAQINAFTPRTRTLLLAILAFEKLLLENSTNRKIFASFDVSTFAFAPSLQEG